jgi:hypothetical protein
MYPGQNPGFLGNSLLLTEFEVHPSKTIPYHTSPNLIWCAISWKILSSVVIVIILTFTLYTLLAGFAENSINNFLPASLAGLVKNSSFWM